MSHNQLNKLPNETVKLLASTQIITSVSTAVKELVENSLDAGAKSIQVKLDNYGFDALEVKDDGHGISSMNVQRMFLPGYTSKISCFDDLGKLQSYGFRGEALAAIVKLSKVSVTTKASTDTLAMTYVINSEGVPESSKPSHISKGTILLVSNLFGNLPVRKQYLSSKKKVGEELKKVEQVVQSLSAIHPELRINLIHNKCPIWQKNSVKGIKQSFMQVVGLKIVAKMEHLNELSHNILVDLIVPKKDLDNVDNIFTNSSQSIFLYINRRPVVLTNLSKVVMEHVFLHFTKLVPVGKFAVCLISVEVPPKEVDVNLEPNKTKVYLKNETEVIQVIDYMLSVYYKQNISRPEPQSENTEDILDKHCEAEDNSSEDLEEEDRTNYGQQKKRPRLEKENSADVISSARYKEFSEKNAAWNLETINEDTARDDIPLQNNSVLGLCSQINKDNCTLTTQEEVSEITKLLNQNGQKLVTSINLDFGKGLKDNETVEGQSNDSLTEITPQAEDAEYADVITNNISSEKPILPSWPIRKPFSPAEVNNSGSTSKNTIKENETKSCDSNTEHNNLLNSEVNCIDNIDPLNWSKGNINTDNGPLVGGVVLAKPKITESLDDEVLKEDVEQFDLSLRSVSSQMGRKDLSAFTKFARIMRPKILNEFPGILFTKVAGLLMDRWKALSADEKKYYEKLSKVVDNARKVHDENKAPTIVPPTKSVFPKKQKIEKSNEKPERYELKLTTSITDIFHKKQMTFTKVPDDDIHLIGQLRPSGNWLYKRGNEVGHVRHSGLQEVILYQRMLSSHSIPRKPLYPKITINETVLGRELWQILLGLGMEYDPLNCTHTIVSDVISKNGFKIDLESNENGFQMGWITEVASVIPFYGTMELKDILTKYQREGKFADLANLRTTSAMNYITNEAVRIVSEAPRSPEISDIKEWIDTWQLCSSKLPQKCLHCRDIFVPFYQLRNNYVDS